MKFIKYFLLSSVLLILLIISLFFYHFIVSFSYPPNIADIGNSVLWAFQACYFILGGLVFLVADIALFLLFIFGIFGFFVCLEIIWGLAMMILGFTGISVSFFIFWTTFYNFFF